MHVVNPVLFGQPFEMAVDDSRFELVGRYDDTVDGVGGRPTYICSNNPFNNLTTHKTERTIQRQFGDDSA
jgi:hypothetical protein